MPDKFRKVLNEISGWDVHMDLSSDPHVNKELEQKLGQLDLSKQRFAIDVLEMLKLFGPMSAKDWTDKIRELYPNMENIGREVGRVAADFKFVSLKNENGQFEWVDDGTGDIDPNITQNIGTLTNIMSNSMDILKRQPDLSIQDFVTQLHVYHQDMPIDVLAGFAGQLSNHFPGSVTIDPDGMIHYTGAPTKTIDDHIEDIKRSLGKPPGT